MSWPSKRVGEFLAESDVQSAAPSAERRIRVRLKAEGVEKRPLLSETEGATRYFRRRAGQFIYGKQNLHKGAFGVIPDELDGFESSSDLPAFDVADGLRPHWLDYFLRQGDFYKSLVNIARGAATKRIQPESFFQVELPVPSPAVQDKLIAKMDLCVEEHAKLEHELTHQETLLGQLQQAILQEAIAGKLTADWRAAHPQAEPARQLLHRIQAEKSRLIAAKQLRPEKPLPKITPEEIPFAIPKTWEWCRIVNATLVIVDCPHSTPQWTDSGMTCAKTGQFRRFHLDLSQRFYVSRQTYAERVERLVPKPDDILYSREGGILGIACRIPAGEKLCLGQRMMLLRPHHPTSAAFLELMLNSPHVTKIADESTLGGCAPHINVGEIKSFVIPLPPLAEQAAIVARVAALLGSSRLLAAEIAHTRTHAAHLLQAVLKEAFTPATS